MTAPLVASRARCGAATLAVAASSAAPVAIGYERGLRPCHVGVSRAANTLDNEETR